MKWCGWKCTDLALRRIGCDCRRQPCCLHLFLFLCLCLILSLCLCICRCLWSERVCERVSE